MARSLWTGALTFGLVSVPIRLASATRSHDLRFNMLCTEEGVRVRRKLVCGPDEAEVEQKDLAKGYEIAPDQYAVVSQEELDALAPKRSREMEVERFVDLAEIDPIYFERSYYLLPAEAGMKAYQLLLRTMQRTGKVGIARFVMRNREYLVAIRPQDQVLGVATLRYHDEVVPMGEIADDLPQADAEVDEKQLKMAEQLVATLSDEWRPEDFADEYRERVLDLVERKIAGQEVLTTEPREEGGDHAKVIDLMSALEQSLAESDQAKGGKAKTRGGKAKTRGGKAKDKRSPSTGGKRGGRKSA